MATQYRYDDCRTLSLSKQNAMKRSGQAGIQIHDVHQISSSIKLTLKPGSRKFILSYTTVDGQFIEFGRSFDKPYLHKGKTIQLNDCSFSMSDKGRDYFPECKRSNLLSNGWKNSEFLTYDDTDECKIDISPEPEDAGKPITLRTVFTNDNYFGTRYIWQRIYFYVGDDEYPFFQMNFNTSTKEQIRHELRFR